MIADFINFAVAGTAFCHAASQLILRRAMDGDFNSVAMQGWIRQQRQYKRLRSSLSARKLPLKLSSRSPVGVAEIR
jgi:hypothetical protein